MDRCERRHWLRYVVGLKEPPLRARGGGEHTNAFRRGLIVHDVLENYEEDLELGVLVEAAIGRWDPDAPPPEGARGIRYRRTVTDNVEQFSAARNIATSWIATAPSASLVSCRCVALASISTEKWT